MKHRGIAVFLAFLLIWCVTASADSVVVEQERVTISCDNLIPGDAYSFIVLHDHNPEAALSENSVFYANQITANEAGAFSITFIHTDLSDCCFLIGGTFPDGESPKMISLYTAAGSAQKTPLALISIEDEAFAGSSFEQVVLGDQVTLIGARAFHNCSKLKRIYIPDSVENIAEDAFEGCENLTVECKAGSAAYEFAMRHHFAVSVH